MKKLFFHKLLKKVLSKELLKKVLPKISLLENYFLMVLVKLFKKA